MTLSEISIRRPVLSTVFVLVIFLLGFIGYRYLGVREYPNIDNPIISVSASYPGANADVIQNMITEPLEASLNGIPGIRSLTSSSSQGSCRIRVEFELNVDLETAANDVRDRVSRAQRNLPRDADPPTVSKADADSQPIMQISVRSETRSLMEVSEIAELTVKEQLQTINNVSAIDIWGQMRYSMRLWLDPMKMAAYGITPMEVKNAVDRENVELPSGSIEGNQIDLSIRTLGLMKTPEEFNDLIIREDGNRIIRFRDIGTAEISPENVRNLSVVNGLPTVNVVIIPQPGANQIEISDEVQRRLVLMEKDLPDDVYLDIIMDNTKFVRASINEVEETILIAFILVAVIIFLFLRDWRVTLIPVVVIPVSLIGAFFVMYLFGFSINVLSMLAVVLAVGLVVDDAIVVTENIYVKIEHGMRPFEAGIEGSKEIFFAVISTTVTLVAVFFPIIFLSGTTGKLFKEFSIVVSGAVIISAFVAITFTPMLATKLLKRRERKNWFYRVTEPFFDGMTRGYGRSLSFFLSHRWLTWPLIAVTGVAILLLFNRIPSEMAPLEDRSQITARITGPEGATFEFIRDYSERIYDIVDSVAPERTVNAMMARSGSGNISISLPDIKDRERSQMDVAAALSAAVKGETAARTFIQQQSTFGGRRGGFPVQYVIRANSIGDLERILPVFMDRVNASPVFQVADVDLKFTKPEIQIEIDREKAKMLGVSTSDIGQTLQYALSGQRMGYYYLNGKQYQIVGEINRQQRNTPVDLKSIYLKNSRGEMIQMDNIVQLRETVAPPTLYRYNRMVSATVSAGLNEGYTIGHGLDEMDRIAADVLEDGFQTTLAGESKEFRESSSSLAFAFVLALLLIFLILAAQFESFKDPFVIMFTVPLAVAGALLFMWANGITFNIYSQIGIIMLIGLVVKNGILIVEFANQRQDALLTKREAIHGASVQRLRPILMTSFSSILGLVPLAVASGEGANGRIAMGVAVIGGLIFSTLISLYIIPAMYMYISTDRGTKRRKAEILDKKEELRREKLKTTKA